MLEDELLDVLAALVEEDEVDEEVTVLVEVLSPVGVVDVVTSLDVVTLDSTLLELSSIVLEVVLPFELQATNIAALNSNNAFAILIMMFSLIILSMF